MHLFVGNITKLRIIKNSNATEHISYAISARLYLQLLWGLPDTQPWLHQKFTVDGMYAFQQNDGLGYRQMSSDESNRWEPQTETDESPKKLSRVDTCLEYYRTCSKNKDLYNAFLHSHSSCYEQIHKTTRCY